MTTTDKIKDTIGNAADKLKHAAQSAAEKVKNVAGDLRNVAVDDMPNMATASRTVILVRRLAASPAEVYRAWTDPDAVVRWWGPEGYTTTDVKMDLRVGGRWSNTMVAADGKRFPSAGEFRQVVTGERLVMFDEGAGEPMNGHATTIEVWCESDGTGTKMHVVHGVFKTVEMRDECKVGWDSSFDRLERLLDGK
jgi:uncharacterized protein YndB with AHSA1/START domain